MKWPLRPYKAAAETPARPALYYVNVIVNEGLFNVHLLFVDSSHLMITQHTVKVPNLIFIFKLCVK